MSYETRLLGFIDMHERFGAGSLKSRWLIQKWKEELRRIRADQEQRQ